MEDVFRHLHIPPELACRFLGVFSRMEYALKSTRYAIGSDRDVAPAWDQFSNEIDCAFHQITEPAIVEARDYLLTHPPRKQTLAGKSIVFIDQIIDKNQKPTQQILLMVRTVRNNLFHGGKYLPEGEAEIGRNNILVLHSLNILLACSKLNNEVKINFET